ncbi:MAG: sulfatase [Myxococcota bacterium]
MRNRWLLVVPVAVALILGVGYLATRTPDAGGEVVPPVPPGPTLDPTAAIHPVAPVPVTLSTASVPGFPDLRSSHQHQFQLDREPAKWSLPEVTLPPKVANLGDEFTLEVEEVPNPRNAKRVLKVLRAPLPFAVETDAQTFRPEGMLLTIDGVPIPFGRGPAPQARRSTWRINGRFFVLSHATLPAAGTVKVRYQGVADDLQRHDPKKAGLEPQAFVQHAVTIDGETRHGLMMVAPTRGEWQVTIPERNAAFDASLALERAPVNVPKPDGADVVLTVTVDGRETVVDRQNLSDPKGGFRPWHVDLSAFAGKQVTLALASEPLGNSVFDWVFVGGPTLSGAPDGDVRRVVVVAVDTTRQDDLSFYGNPVPTTPEIDTWIGTGVSFDHTWSTAPRTRPSFRSSTTGRLPLDAVGQTNIGEVFAEHGFATGGFVANVHLQPKFGFDDGFDVWKFDGSADAATQVDRALGWLGDNRNVDSYLFLHLMDPHMAYDAPGAYRDKFLTDPDPSLPQKIKRSEVLAMMKAGTLDDRKKQHLRQLHDGELAYTSHELGRLFDAIDRMPGRSLVVLYSDHGEEFWEHGGFEHNHTLYDELTRTVFALRPRGGLAQGERVGEPVTLMDLAPTLYDLCGFADAPGSHGRSLVPLLLGDDAAWPDRPLPVGYLQYSHERWGVVWNGHKYVLHTGTGREELYDLTADPGEQHDLSEVRDLEPYRKRLQEAHGVPVGPGWRIRLKLAPGDGPLTVELPAKAVSVDVLDPESVIEHRANVEWGELPKRIPPEIGTVATAADGRSFTFTRARSRGHRLRCSTRPPIRVRRRRASGAPRCRSRRPSAAACGRTASGRSCSTRARSWCRRRPRRRAWASARRPRGPRRTCTTCACWATSSASRATVTKTPGDPVSSMPRWRIGVPRPRG